MRDPAPLPSEERIRELTADPELSPEEASRTGDLFVQAGKLAQAMMFFERSRDRERLSRVKQEAIRAGDAFFLHWITRLAPDLVTEADWRDAGDRARAEGKLLFARDCYEKAGDPEKTQAVREEWLKIFPAPARPEGRSDGADPGPAPPTSSPSPKGS